MVPRNELVAAGFFQRYIHLTQEEEVRKALEKSTKLAKKLLKQIPHKRLDYVYEEGKWTIPEIVQHLIDAERVFAYRAMSFARKDPNTLPGFEESQWADAVRPQVGKRSWEDLVEEFKTLRKSTEYLFASFGDAELRGKGIASGNAVNTLALGFIIAGHLVHHIQVIKERYL